MADLNVSLVAGEVQYFSITELDTNGKDVTPVVLDVVSTDNNVGQGVIDVIHDILQVTAEGAGSCVINVGDSGVESNNILLTVTSPTPLPVAQIVLAPIPNPGTGIFTNGPSSFTAPVTPASQAGQSQAAPVIPPASSTIVS
jgi:hypothetical protein